MSTNFQSLIKNYKNLLMFLLVPIITAVSASSMLDTYVIINNNIEDNNLYNKLNTYKNNNRAFAQQTNSPSASPTLPLPSIPSPTLPVQVPTNKITIALSSAQLSPLTNPTYNQLKIITNYNTNDASLLNTQINGILKVSLLNGTIVKTSSFPNGFILNQTGSIQFATSFTDKSIQNVTAQVVLTDLSKTNALSNTITTNVYFNNLTASQ